MPQDGSQQVVESDVTAMRVQLRFGRDDVRLADVQLGRVFDEPQIPSTFPDIEEKISGHLLGGLLSPWPNARGQPLCDPAL
jgi:hypothetical protein